MVQGNNNEGIHQMTTSTHITDEKKIELASDIMQTALSGYWGHFVDWRYKKNDGKFSRYDQVESYRVTEIEPDLGVGVRYKLVTTQDVIDFFEKVWDNEFTNTNKYNLDFFKKVWAIGDYCEANLDGADADMIIQCVVFGEIVYG